MIEQKGSIKRFVVSAAIIGIAVVLGLASLFSFGQANEGVYRVQVVRGQISKIINLKRYLDLKLKMLEDQRCRESLDDISKM